MKMNSRFILSLIFLLGTMHSLHSQIMNQTYTGAKSNRIAKTIKDEIEISNQTYLHKNLKIIFKKVDMEIGTGTIQVFDDDRNQYFQFDLINKLENNDGFFKIPIRNNQTYAVVAFRANGGNSIVNVYFMVNSVTKEIILMIKNFYYDKEIPIFLENWYFDLQEKVE